MSTIIKRYNEYLQLISQLQIERRTTNSVEDKISFYGSILVIGKILAFVDGRKTARINGMTYNAGIHFSVKEKNDTAYMFAQEGLLGNDLRLYCTKCKSFNVKERGFFQPLCNNCQGVKNITILHKNKASLF